MQEGMCKNCGSIVYVDPKQENCHCLFCDCVFPAKEALEIAKNPGNYEFLNEEQPKYVGEEINPQHSKVNANLDQAIAKNKKSSAKAKAKPKYRVERKELPNVNLSVKQVLSLVGICVVIAGLFLAITLPLTTKRDAQRTEITEQFKADIGSEPFSKLLEFDEGFSISRMGNTAVDLITEGGITKEDAKVIFQVFCDTRAKAMDIASEDTAKKYNSVELRISMAGKGGFLIKNQSIEDLKNADSIVELP